MQICEYCNQTVSKYYLKIHQTKTKYCLKIQQEIKNKGKINKDKIKIQCKYCNKIFSNKRNLKVHLANAKRCLKIRQEKKKKITEDNDKNFIIQTLRDLL